MILLVLCTIKTLSFRFGVTLPDLVPGALLVNQPESLRLCSAPQRDIPEYHARFRVLVR